MPVLTNEIKPTVCVFLLMQWDCHVMIEVHVIIREVQGIQYFIPILSHEGESLCHLGFECLFKAIVMSDENFFLGRCFIY